MIIDEINETNFLEKRSEGQVELNAKFAAWDRLGKLKNSMPLEEFHKKAGWAFRDPSIWAYGTLKDKEGKRLEVHPFQDRIMNDKNRFVHVHAANQIGKTWAAADIKGLHHAIHVDNASVMAISSREDQAIGILDEMKWMMKRARIDYDEMIGEISNRTELHIYTKKDAVSVIRTFPPTLAILSFPATFIIMDEDNFWKKIDELTPVEYYDQCIEPRTNATKTWKHPFLTMGQIMGISNPNGQQGLGWRCLEDDERYNNYIYCWLANPNNTLEEYLLHKRRLPPHRFASVYAATYTSAEGGFITLEQYNAFAEYNRTLRIDLSKVLYLGGDVASEDPKGKNTDWNTLYGVQQIERYEKDAKERLPRVGLVYRKEWKPATRTTEIYAEIKRLVNLGYNIKFAYDKVGVGDKIKNDLIDRGILSRHNIEVLTYSLPNKSDVYINLQTMFEQGLIEGRDIPKLREQLFGLKVEQPLGSVHLKIHHKTSGIKDDEPDALANACWAARFHGVTASMAPLEEIKGDESHRRYIQVCKVCEKEGKDGYHYGYSKSKLNFEKVPCSIHF